MCILLVFDVLFLDVLNAYLLLDIVYIHNVYLISWLSYSFTALILVCLSFQQLPNAEGLC